MGKINYLFKSFILMRPKFQKRSALKFDGRNETQNSGTSWTEFCKSNYPILDLSGLGIIPEAKPSGINVGLIPRPLGRKFVWIPRCLRRGCSFILALFLIFLLFDPPLSKAQEKGVYHLVKKNETFWSIARAYGISVQKLSKINNIADINSIKENSVLFIPSATRVIDNIADEKSCDTDIKAKKSSSGSIRDIEKNEDIKKRSPLTKIEQSKKEDTEKSPLETIQNKKLPEKKILSQKALVPRKKIKAGRNIFIWPVQGEVKSHFGVQPNKTFHNWIKIISFAGKKIKAAESGTVIFSSNLKNYGETIIIRHKDNFATVYTHMKRRLVKIDKNVRKGESIAVLGEKDDAGKVYFNFEIRIKGKAHDPLLFLP
ncbi:MAG: M23 family metallopeptidase [Syntrophaceae bacterium]|nr:M23 family metallopeptidase [Syntrophaceae bacterium]